MKMKGGMQQLSAKMAKSLEGNDDASVEVP